MILWEIHIMHFNSTHFPVPPYPSLTLASSPHKRKFGNKTNKPTPEPLSLIVFCCVVLLFLFTRVLPYCIPHVQAVNIFQSFVLQIYFTFKFTLPVSITSLVTLTKSNLRKGVYLARGPRTSSLWWGRHGGRSGRQMFALSDCPMQTVQGPSAQPSFSLFSHDLSTWDAFVQGSWKLPPRHAWVSWKSPTPLC